jgi:D-threonate/D-erythronate kinase
MLEVAVIADDLTGAAETGVAFLSAYSDARLVSADDLVTLAAESVAPILAVDTHSRALSVADARLRVESCAERLMAWRPRRVFKKIDSCMRGNMGAEADAVIDAMNLPISFVAPSYPEMGRITIGDIHLVNGQPAADSEIGRNANEPVRESRLSLAVAAQSRYPVDRVGIETVIAGAEPLRLSVARLVAQGVRHITFDATERRHLTAVAALALKHFPTALLVGSGGLATALCDQLPRVPATLTVPLPAATGHHLIALGTASGQARRQIAKLRRDYPVQTVVFDPARLASAERAPDEAELARLVEALMHGDVVAHIATPCGKEWSQIAPQVVKGFGALIAAAVSRVRPAGLFLSGGDTAFSVLGQLGIRQLKLEHTIVPGLVLSTVVGTAFSGLAVGTKPGSFGDDDALLRWRHAFASKGTGYGSNVASSSFGNHNG